MQIPQFFVILSSLLYLASASPISHSDRPTGSPTSPSDVKAVYEPSLLRGLSARALDLLSRKSSSSLYSHSRNNKPKPASRKASTRSRASTSNRQFTKQKKTNSKGKTTPTVAKSCAYHPGRGRKLFGRDDCDIHLTLKNVHDDKSVTETIKAGSKDLGEGAGANNNAGVHKIDKWGDQQGPFIAKKFHNEQDMKKEVKNLKKAGHLIAEGDASNPWVVMKHAAGAPLTKTPEYEKALASKKEDCESFMQSRHGELSKAVVDLHTSTDMLHTDLKDENVHWTFDGQGKGTANLLDFGQMATGKAQVDKFLKMKKHNSVEDYATHRAEGIYSTGKCKQT